MSNLVYLPFPRELYDDLIRFSDGRINPAGIAEERVETWLTQNLENFGNALFNDERFDEAFGERIHDLAEKYAPHLLNEWAQQESTELNEWQARRKPLVWKEITVGAGADVRMSYGGDYYYAEVRNGKIVDDDGEFSPSEWAFKVANHTSRNAWRDIWFRESGATAWVPAQLLREQAREAQRKLGAENA